MTYEGRRQTTWRILRAVYVRVLAKGMGRDPNRMTEAERTAILEPWLDAMAADVRMLMEVSELARSEGISHVHETYHRLENVDHECLDEAIGWAEEEGRRKRDESDDVDK